MFPYRDENDTQRAAVVTGLIIALNLFVWVFVQGAGFSDRTVAASVCNYGLIPGELTGTLPVGTAFPLGHGLVCLTDPGREPQHILSSMFMHGGWLHLLGNMWFLWLFGNNIEDSMTRPRFVVFYLLCGLAAAMAQVIADPSSRVPMVGASGAISGVMGAYLILFPRVKVYTLVPIFIFITSIALPAWVMLLYWFVLQVLGEATRMETGGVAFWAHIGGFVAGILLIKVFVRHDRLDAHRAGHWEPDRVGWK